MHQNNIHHQHNKTRHLSKILVFCLFMLSLSACGPGGDVNPQSNKFLIYNYDPSTQSYQLERVQIKTIRNVRAVDGDKAFMRGGGSFTSAVDEPKTEEEWKKALLVEGSRTPTVEYTIDADGTVVPWDYDSAMMLTVYHHLERSAEYFDSIPTQDISDLPKSKLSEIVGRIPVYYYPQIGLLGIPLPIFVDNAAYAFTMDAFIIPPRLSFTDAVPIYANRGVMTHEYGHAVFNRVVFDGKPVPDFLINETAWIPSTSPDDVTDALGEDAPAALQGCHHNKGEENSSQWVGCNYLSLNELRGLDEGMADIFAFLDVKDPNFIAPSIMQDIGRDMSVKRFYDEDVVKEMTYNSGADYYQLGSVVASVFYRLRAEFTDLNDDELGRIMIKSLRDIKNPKASFRVSSFFEAWLRNLPEKHRDAAYTAFVEQLPTLTIQPPQ